jgi:hypothetical protein
MKLTDLAFRHEQTHSSTSKRVTKNNRSILDMIVG